MEEELGDVERGGFDFRGGGVVVVAGSFGEGEEGVDSVDEFEQEEDEGRDCVPHALLAAGFCGDDLTPFLEKGVLYVDIGVLHEMQKFCDG